MLRLPIVAIRVTLPQAALAIHSLSDTIAFALRAETADADDTTGRFGNAASIRG